MRDLHKMYGRGGDVHGVVGKKIGYCVLEMRSFINRGKTVSRKGKSQTVSAVNRSLLIYRTSNPLASLL